MRKGELTEQDCKERTHWETILPQRFSDLPLTGYDKRKKYIYYFLITAYREMKRKNDQEIARLESRIRKLKPAYVEYMAVKDKIKRVKHTETEIFKGKRIDTYSSV